MLFKPFKPMEPVSHLTPPASPRYLYQVKWDGVRIIAHIGRGSVFLHNRKLHERTHHYPELAALADLISGEAILDGEVVALKEGRPNFPLVLERDLISGASTTAARERVRRAAARVPVFYMIFDMVFLNGEDLTNRPLTERQALLQDVLQEDDTVHLVESFEDGEKLFSVISERKMEGILAKEKESRYFFGRKDSSWLKIKVRQQQLVAIGGYTVKEGRINALLAGVYHNGKLVYAGRVATGLKARDLAELTPYLKASRRTSPPFDGAAVGKDKNWVEPRLVALVEFQEWTEELRMRQPVIKGFTRDKPTDCVLGRVWAG